MLVYAKGNPTPLRGDVVQKVILRSDLSPVPVTLELEARETAETVAMLKHGAVVEVGHGRVSIKLVKVERTKGTGLVQGDREVAFIKAVGLLDACAPIASMLQRAVIREGASLGEIYRACGAQVRIEHDFTVPVWACYSGMTPSFEVSKVLQEEAGVLLYSGGRVAFRRLRELVEEKAAHNLAASQTKAVESGFLELHGVPFAFTTGPTGTFIVGRRDSARGAHYRPRADARIVENLSKALVLRRRYQGILSPDINAGARFDVDGTPMVAITAAHVFDAGAEGGGGQEQYSKFWLGEVVK